MSLLNLLINLGFLTVSATWIGGLWGPQWPLWIKIPLVMYFSGVLLLFEFGEEDLGIGVVMLMFVASPIYLVVIPINCIINGEQGPRPYIAWDVLLGPFISISMFYLLVFAGRSSKEESDPQASG